MALCLHVSDAGVSSMVSRCRSSGAQRGKGSQCPKGAAGSRRRYGSAGQSTGHGLSFTSATAFPSTVWSRCRTPGVDRDGIRFADDWRTRVASFVSPSVLLPRHRCRFARSQEAGKHVFYRTGGCINQALPDLPDLGSRLSTEMCYEKAARIWGLFHGYAKHFRYLT